MHVTNIGGSVTTAVCLTLIAWSIRVLRSAKLADKAAVGPGWTRQVMLVAS
jgi:hypothetical protein